MKEGNINNGKSYDLIKMPEWVRRAILISSLLGIMTFGITSSRLNIIVSMIIFILIPLVLTCVSENARTKHRPLSTWVTIIDNLYITLILIYLFIQLIAALSRS